jgi:Tc5 transposase DNA-binding domain
MPDEEQIQRAIAHLKAQKQPNIAAALREFNVPRTTLSERFHRHSVSHAEATANTRLKLSPAQEKTLVTYINKLSDRGLPPTPGIVRNLAEELLESEIREHWVSRFCKRHRNELSSVYLRAINHKQKIADNSLYFKHYFKLISFKSKLRCRNFFFYNIKTYSSTAI